ncbi:MAG: ATP-binding protein [Acidobacteria bacterium]|nr:ATP-binding protein [Acidobacteriota bacterium]
MVALSDNTITYLGRTTFRNRGIPFGIKESDCLCHMYVIGRTGTGKSTLLETLMQRDIAQGNGMALLDPHGDLAEKIIGALPDRRKEDLMYFNAPDPDQPYGYYPLKRVIKGKRPLVASGLVEVMKKMWDDAWGLSMEHILRNALLVLLDQEHVTLPDILRLFHDDAFWKRVGAECTNQQVKAFWLTEYPKYSYRLRADGIMPIPYQLTC